MSQRTGWQWGNQFRWRTAALLGAASFVCQRSASAIVIRDDVPDSQYINLAAQTQYAGIGYVDAVTGTSNGQINYNFGSGTLIAPDWVLTAAHVVTMEGTGTLFPVSGMSFGLGPSMSFPGTDAVVSAVTESGWSGNFMAGNDLALLQLSVPITNVAPATLYPTTLGTASLAGDTATVLGYGNTGNGLTGYTNGSFGTLRGLQNVIDTTGGTTTNGGAGNNTNYNFVSYSRNLIFSDFDSPDATTAASENVMGSSTALALEGSTAPGDSGGGLFVNVDGVNYLAGVTSFGGSFSQPAPLSVYGEINAFTSTAAATSASFILSTLSVSSSWNSTSGGTWASLANWTGNTLPEFKRATATFGSAIQADSTINLDAAWTVGLLTFNNSNSYTLAAGNGGSLTLDNSANSAGTSTVTDSLGNHFVTAPVSLISNLNVNVVGSGNTLSISGSISGVGSIRASGAGTLALSGVNSYFGPTTVAAGALKIGAAAALPAGSDLIVGGPGATAMASFASGIGTVSLASLTISTGSTVDVADNEIAINFDSPADDPIATLSADLAAGNNGGSWTGTGITSRTAAANPALFAVGYADGNIDLASVAQPNQILVKYTLAGDASLNGTVDFPDLVAVAQHFGDTGMDWADGNFTYDPAGSVGFADLVLVAQNFGQSVSSSELAGPAGTISLAWQSVQVQTTAAVPEPAALAVLAAGAGLLAGRRRKGI